MLLAVIHGATSYTVSSFDSTVLKFHDFSKNTNHGGFKAARKSIDQSISIKTFLKTNFSIHDRFFSQKSNKSCN